MGSTNKNYIKDIISNYCVIDTETTGLSSYYDEIIEIGILKIVDNKIVDRYSQLIKPTYEIDSFVTYLTGITNEMVEGMPSIMDVKNEVLNFIGNDVIIGHNTSFDIRFLNEGFEIELDNKYMDTMQFARKLYPELNHHRLSDLTSFLNLHNNEHRALSDCISTKQLYDSMKLLMKEKNLAIEDLWYQRNSRKGIDIKEIKAENVEIDEDNFFYNRHVVFTGKLDRMLRKEAMQIIVNLGGVLDNNVTKKTNYLILGDNDYNAILRGNKSSKHLKAEKYKKEGQDIEVIDELTFYDLIEM